MQPFYISRTDIRKLKAESEDKFKIDIDKLDIKLAISANPIYAFIATSLHSDKSRRNTTDKFGNMKIEKTFDAPVKCRVKIDEVPRTKAFTIVLEFDNGYLRTDADDSMVSSCKLTLERLDNNNFLWSSKMQVTDMEEKREKKWGKLVPSFARRSAKKLVEGMDSKTPLVNPFANSSSLERASTSSDDVSDAGSDAEEQQQKHDYGPEITRMMKDIFEIVKLTMKKYGTSELDFSPTEKP
jgi:hypothetical protein